MLPSFQTSAGVTDLSPKHALLAARRVIPFKHRRQLPALPAILLCIGIGMLGYQAWYAAAKVTAFVPAAHLGSLKGSRGGSAGGAAAGAQRYSRRQLARRDQLPRSFPAPRLRNLVLVACHSVYTGLDFRNSDEQSSWFLLDYQKVPGQTRSFVQHIQLGVEQAAGDPSSLLLFSGGKTRREAGPRAEGEGYWMVAEAAGWYGHPKVRERTFTEDHARDSYENLLFSLCRFYELTGHYPDSVVVVGYEFKRERFMHLHRAALAFPLSRFHYLGTPALNQDAVQGEGKTVAAFRTDPYGCSDALAGKRATRDPFSHGGLTPDRCPEMGALLQHCGPQPYEGELPWGRQEGEGEDPFRDDSDSSRGSHSALALF